MPFYELEEISKWDSSKLGKLFREATIEFSRLSIAIFEDTNSSEEALVQLERVEEKLAPKLLKKFLDEITVKE